MSLSLFSPKCHAFEENRSLAEPALGSSSRPSVRLPRSRGPYSRRASGIAPEADPPAGQRREGQGLWGGVLERIGVLSSPAAGGVLLGAVVPGAGVAAVLIALPVRAELVKLGEGGRQGGKGGREGRVPGARRSQPGEAHALSPPKCHVPGETALLPGGVSPCQAPPRAALWRPDDRPDPTLANLVY
jgi:hypothetical protein